MSLASSARKKTQQKLIHTKKITQLHIWRQWQKYNYLTYLEGQTSLLQLNLGFFIYLIKVCNCVHCRIRFFVAYRKLYENCSLLGL